MRTVARRDGDDWVLYGTKMWITNGDVADVAVVWANTDEGIRGFVVPTGTPGFSANDIHEKMSLRASITRSWCSTACDCPPTRSCPGSPGLKGPLSCLNEARYGIVWGVGAARACFETALDYSIAREQFGKPIAAFQLTQKKLADMALELNKGMLLALHLGRMKDEAPHPPGAGQLWASSNNAREASGHRPRVPRHPRRQRHHPGVPGHPPHEQPRIGVHVRGHQRDPHAVIGEALTGIAAYR